MTAAPNSPTERSCAEGSSRRVAMEVLGRVLTSTARLQEVLPERAKVYRLSRRDEAFARELAAGCIRRLLTLDSVLEAFCAWRTVEEAVRHILRLGLYQLMFCDAVPARAAVHESVELARKIGKPRAAGFLNAVLRAIARDMKITRAPRPTGPPYGRQALRAIYCQPGKWATFSRDILPDPQQSEIAYLSRQLSYPEWLVRRWLARYGRKKTWNLCEAGNEKPPIFLRPHAPKADCQKLIELLAQEGIKAEPSPSGRTVKLPTRVDTRTLKVLREGHCQVQDDSTAAVVPFLDPAKRARVLDLCAAPGGKTCQIAEMVGEEGQVIAVDDDAKRLRRLFENLERLGLDNVAVVEADGRALSRECGTGKFDFVLVDAPCSNTAVLRRRLEARWRVTEASLIELSGLQYALALSGASALKPGGKMVYSTCTMEPEENQNVLTALVAAGVSMAMEQERQIFPTMGGGDGVYMARLVRKG